MRQEAAGPTEIFEFPKPKEPECGPIERFHSRAPDGMIAVVPKDGFQRPYFLAPGDLQMWFPAMLQELTRDSYFSLNSFHDNGNRTRRTKANLKYLNLAWADLDCYNVGLKPWETIGKCGQMMDDGELPRISAMAKSGAGVWIFWMLQAGIESDLPIKAVKEKIIKWDRIQQSLCSRLSHLGADPNSKDGARVARIHGSINSKHPAERVSYLFLEDPTGPALYTLEDLAGWFQLVEPPKRKVLTPPKPERQTITLKPGEWKRVAITPPKAARDNVKVQAGKLSYKNQVSRKLRDWQNLCRMRFGFAEGEPSRNVAAYIGASLHLRNGHNLEDTRARMEEFNSTFRPPLSAEEFNWAITEAVKITRSGSRPFSYEGLRDRLKITRREAAALEGEYYPEPKPTKKARIAARRVVVGELLQTVRPRPSLRTLQKILDERGHAMSLRTVWKDCAALEDQHRVDQKKLSFARDE